MRIVGDGGLVTQSHPHTVRIVDCRMWRSEHAALLLLLRPRAAVSVTGCGDSLTGFEVRRRISKATPLSHAAAPPPFLTSLKRCVRR